MVLSSILTFSRAQAQTDSNGLTDANGVVFANEANQDYHRQLVVHGIDASGISEQSINMTAGSGKYNYPSNPSMLFLKAIELDYTGSGGSNYKTASQIDISNLPGSPQGSFSWYRANASTQTPLFDDHGSNFEIFPTPTGNITAGINIVYFSQPSVYATVSDTVLYPENIDPTILGFRIAANYKRSLMDFNAAQNLDDQYIKKITDYIQTLGRGSQQPTQATPLQIDGFQF